MTGKIVLCTDYSSGFGAIDAYRLCISHFYPDFDDWFSKKVLPDMGITRQILFFIGDDGSVQGAEVLKDSPAEKKDLCDTRFAQIQGARHRHNACRGSFRCVGHGLSTYNYT